MCRDSHLDAESLDIERVVNAKRGDEMFNAAGGAYCLMAASPVVINAVAGRVFVRVEILARWSAMSSLPALAAPLPALLPVQQLFNNPILLSRI